MIKPKEHLKQLSTLAFKLLPNFLINRYRRNKITILLYHEIAPSLFSEHLTFLQSSYSIISLDSVANSLTNDNPGALPDYPLVITFDDGWRSNYNLLPIIKKTSTPTTIFLTTKLIDTNRVIWNYTLDRRGTERELNIQLKGVPNKKKNKILYQHNGYYPEREYDERVFLSTDEVREMIPWVDFQSHGEYHPVFTMCDNAELKKELRGSKEFIENNFYTVCNCIAYPYGIVNDRVIQHAKQSGYQLGRTANKTGLNDHKSDPFRLHSIGIDSQDNVKALERKLAWAQVRNIWNNTRS